MKFCPKDSLWCAEEDLYDKQDSKKVFSAVYRFLQTVLIH